LQWKAADACLTQSVATSLRALSAESWGMRSQKITLGEMREFGVSRRADLLRRLQMQPPKTMAPADVDNGLMPSG
jgi:hypothetical protein